jgi:hypothetical protein
VFFFIFKAPDFIVVSDDEDPTLPRNKEKLKNIRLSESLDSQTEEKEEEEKDSINLENGETFEQETEMGEELESQIKISPRDEVFIEEEDTEPKTGMYDEPKSEIEVCPENVIKDESKKKEMKEKEKTEGATKNEVT